MGSGFQFQIGAIKSLTERSFGLSEFQGARMKFQFQIGAIKRANGLQYVTATSNFSFNSKLVRLKGYPKSTLILYCTLTVIVQLIFILIRLEGSLLSTSNRAKSLGG